MHFKIEKNQLIETAQSASKAISSRSTLPILGGLLLTVKNDNLIAYATDLEVAIKQSSKLKVDEEIETVVPARLFLDIVKNFPEGLITVTFNKQDNRLELTSTNSQFSINTLSAEDYPKFPDIEGSITITTDTSNLIKAINSISNSASRDESRPILTGILLSVNNNKAELTATDSYRLATTNINISSEEEGEKELIIPVKTFEALANMSPKDDSVNILISNNQVNFAFDQTTIATKLISGQFPDYKLLFPEKHETSLVINKEDFLKALKRVSLMSHNNSPLRLNIKDDKVKITTKTAEVGEAREELLINKNGPDMEIAFNAKYLIDGVSGASEKNILIKLSDPLQPGMISNKKDDRYKYLIMPIRLS